MSSIMAARVGKNGKINSFEPHPEIFAELSFNVEEWQKHSHIGHITTHQVALSASNGIARLGTEDIFESNRGTASVVSGEHATLRKSFMVKTKSLDDLYLRNESIGLMKINVEGHEISVLRGSNKLLRHHQIRDIIFEEHAEPPTPVTEFLQECGYTIFYIVGGFWGITVHSLKSYQGIHRKTSDYESASYVAMMDPKRALSQLNKKGWNVLKARVR